MTRLSKEDFDKLDALLSKHGFGGYYDLLECIKMSIQRVTEKDVDLTDVKDLPGAVGLLMAATAKVEKKRHE